MDNKIREIKAVIFDLDGTLVDSEPVYLEADKKLFARYGIEIDTAFKSRYVGRAAWEMLQEVKLMYHLSETVAELVAEKNAIYLELARQKTCVFPEMRKFVRLLHENNYPMAVASGSSQEVIDEVLNNTDMEQYFVSAISSTNVKRGKPAPDVFLEAAKRLTIQPENCLVMEDSHYGVEAAKSAGMYCIAAPFDAGGAMHGSFQQADLLFEQGIESFKAKEAFCWLTK